jgi:hypothetical protein
MSLGEKHDVLIGREGMELGVGESEGMTGVK